MCTSVQTTTPFTFDANVSFVYYDDVGDISKANFTGWGATEVKALDKIVLYSIDFSYQFTLNRMVACIQNNYSQHLLPTPIRKIVQRFMETHLTDFIWSALAK